MTRILGHESSIIVDDDEERLEPGQVGTSLFVASFDFETETSVHCLVDRRGVEQLRDTLQFWLDKTSK